MQEIIACLGDKKANFASGSVLFLNKVGPCWEAALQVVSVWMSLEGHKWVDDVQVWFKKKRNNKPQPTNHFSATLNTFSSHPLPHLMLHHVLLGMGTSLGVLAATLVGCAWGVHPRCICSCGFASLLLLCYFRWY